MAKLIDITGLALSGEWGTDDEDGKGIPVLRTTNFTNDGVVNYMKTNIVIWIEDVKAGRNNNWIVLETVVGFFNNNKRYRIEFCGTEIITDIPFLKEEKEKLATMLAADFGYAPYDLNAIRKIIGDGINYVLVR